MYQFVGDKSIMLPNPEDWKSPELIQELRAPVLIAYNVEMGEDGNPECVWLDYHVNEILLKDVESYNVIQKMKTIEEDLCRYYPDAKCWLIAKPGHQGTRHLEWKIDLNPAEDCQEQPKVDIRSKDLKTICWKNVISSQSHKVDVSS